MKSKMRNRTAQFKGKVALAAAKGDKTTADQTSNFDVQPYYLEQCSRLLRWTRDS